MNKLTKIAAIVAAFVAVNSSVTYAATVQTAQVTASVDTQLSLDMAVSRENADTTLTPVGSAAIPFGTLLRPTLDNGQPGALRGANAYHVFLGANSSGRPYKIQSTMASMSNGSVTLPDAMGLFFARATANNVDIPGDTLPAVQSALGTNKVVYTSNTTGDAGTVELVYGISGGTATGTPFTGWTAIPPSQAAGNYSSTLTYTIVLT